MAVIGIDLGTTNSLAGVWQDGKVVLIPNAFGEYLTPSVVSIGKNQEVFVGSVAKEMLATQPYDTFREFKRNMGTNFLYGNGRKKYRAEELSAFVLRRLKEDAEKFLGEEVTEAVISVPAYFDDNKRNATKNAGRLAGLKVERLINEPSAVALKHHTAEKGAESFIVFDFGGGTLDVSLVEAFDNVVEIQAVAGDNYLGVKGKTIARGLLMWIIIAVVIIAVVVLVLILNGAERRIPVQYAQKVQGRRSVGGRSTYIPVKVNTANVMPVIFASSLMSMPQIIGSFFGYQIDVTTIGGKIMAMLSSNYWFRPSLPFYSIGVVVYVALLIVFAYFYTSISFNPLEIADNMKKSGGFIPGVRPGKPTSDFLNNMLNHLIIIGAVGLTIIALLPIILSGIFNITRLSFMGTSLIIIVNVVLETAKSIESKMVAREYESIF